MQVLASDRQFAYTHSPQPREPKGRVNFRGLGKELDPTCALSSVSFNLLQTPVACMYIDYC